jgi:hypothetical protein
MQDEKIFVPTKGVVVRQSSYEKTHRVCRRGKVRPGMGSGALEVARSWPLSQMSWPLSLPCAT